MDLAFCSVQLVFHLSFISGKFTSLVSNCYISHVLDCDVKHVAVVELLLHPVRGVVDVCQVCFKCLGKFLVFVFKLCGVCVSCCSVDVGDEGYGKDCADVHGGSHGCPFFKKDIILSRIRCQYHNAK